MANFLSIGRLPKALSRFDRHQHPTWEFILYTHGHGTVTVGEQPIPFRPGTIVCQPPFLPHEEESPTGYRNYFIHFRSYPRGDGRVPVLEDDHEGSFHQTTRRLHEEFHARRPAWEQFTTHLAGLLLGYLQRWDTDSAIHPAVQALRGTLDRRHADPELAIATALREQPVSPNHLRKLFANQVGRTPLAYLTERRIEHAKTLLAYTDMSVRQCADAVGFTDALYFSKVFKRHTGISPSRFSPSSASSPTSRVAPPSD